MSLFGKKDGEGVLGVDLGLGGIKLVELADKGGRPSLVTYGFTSGYLGVRQPEEAAQGQSEEDKQKQQEQQDAAQMQKQAAALKELINQTGAKSKQVVASIPISTVFSAVMTVTKTDDKDQIAAEVQAEARKLLPVDIAEVALDYTELPEIFTDEETSRKSQTKVLMTAAPKKIIARFTTIFKEAGLTLKSLESEASALVRSLVGEDPAATLVLDIGHGRSNLYLVRGGIPLIHRSVNIGGEKFTKALQGSLGVSKEEAEQIKIDMAVKREGEKLLEVFRPVVDPVVQEIKYHLELFEKQLGHATARPDKLVLTGGSSLLPHLDTYLENYFEMRSFVGDPWQAVVYPQALKMALDQIGPRFAIPIGLALSNFEKKKEKKN